MFMYVCMYVCVCVCMCVCTHVMYVCICKQSPVWNLITGRRNGVRETKGQWEQDNELDDVTLEAPYHATKSKTYCLY